MAILWNRAGALIQTPRACVTRKIPVRIHAAPCLYCWRALFSIHRFFQYAVQLSHRHFPFFVKTSMHRTQIPASRINIYANFRTSEEFFLWNLTLIFISNLLIYGTAGTIILIRIIRSADVKPFLAIKTQIVIRISRETTGRITP